MMMREPASSVLFPDSGRRSGLYQAASSIVRRLREAGHQAYFVGGCVRDLIMGMEPGDFDIVTSASPGMVEALFARTIPVGVQFGVMLVLEGGYQFEVATFRAEKDYEDGRRPSQVAFSSVEEDVRRRDFTINGLLLDPENGQVIDYVNGQEDIRNQIVRTIGDPDARFSEDHLRMLRAVRFAANLDFEIDGETIGAIERLAHKIDLISAERVRDEITRSLIGGHARRGLELLSACGLLARILPEVFALRGVNQPPAFHPEGDAWEHTLRMLALLPSGESFEGNDSVCLAWSAMLHDIGKAVTRSEDSFGVHFYGHVSTGAQMAEDILKRLNFSNDDRNKIKTLVGSHMRFMHVRQMRPNKLKRFIRQPEFALHLELHRLDCLGSHKMLDNYEFCRQKLQEMPEAMLHPLRLITGHDLKAMGYVPGPLYKEIIQGVEDAQLDGEVLTMEEAVRLISEKWPLRPKI